eukprot:SAG22_NODE_1453_length_4394_cov_29.832363_3_plen_97_part_00
MASRLLPNIKSGTAGSLPDISAFSAPAGPARSQSSMGVISSHRHKALRPERDGKRRDGAVGRTLGHLLPAHAVSSIERGVQDIDRAEQVIASSPCL